MTKSKHSPAATRLLVSLTVLFFVSQTPSQAQHVTYLDQGWDDNTRQEFYYTPQGSQLIRYS